jgi:hypothetical protein
MINAGSPAYLASHGVPRTLQDLQSQSHRMIHYSRTLGAKPYGWQYQTSTDGKYATLRCREYCT